MVVLGPDYSDMEFDMKNDRTKNDPLQGDQIKDSRKFSVTLDLTLAEYDALMAYANYMKMTPKQMVRGWVMDKIRGYVKLYGK